MVFIPAVLSLMWLEITAQIFCFGEVKFMQKRFHAKYLAPTYRLRSWIKEADWSIVSKFRIFALFLNWDYCTKLISPLIHILTMVNFSWDPFCKMIFLLLLTLNSILALHYQITACTLTQCDHMKFEFKNFHCCRITNIGIENCLVQNFHALTFFS